MRKFFTLIFITITCLSCSNDNETMEQLTNRVFNVAKQQYTAMDKRLDDKTLPRSFNYEGTFISSNIYWWCSGFYPGSLWYIYEYTKDNDIKELAVKNTMKLDSVQYVTKDHDVGFQINCSYGNAYRITSDSVYKSVIYQGAKSLSTRFNSTIGAIKSWDFVRKGRDWEFPVIIDNMMNLELLLNASEIYGDKGLRDIACTHANTTIKNHFRSNYSTYHLIDYDTLTGKVRSKQTVQGLSDSSSWSRGQAWAVYSFTMMFRFTGYQNYLFQAEHIADMIASRLPEDGIPYWDFDAPDKKETPKDASSAAIIASAFIELSKYVSDSNKKEKYIGIAEKQLRTLSSDKYLAKVGENGNFLLKHSVGSYPDNMEVDVPLTYADYYFLEALIRYKNLNK